MKEISHSVTYKEVESISELPDEFQKLLAKAKEAINDSYSPYSNFKVGAAVLLKNGLMVKGSNQENASYPVGICAERVTLSAASATYANVPVTAMAISAKTNDYILTNPVTPCGLCRQTLLEYEERFHTPIQIILQGEEGKIIWISSVKDLLPLSFGKDDLNSR